MTDTNIGYWEAVLRNPTPTYKELIETERTYLIDKISNNSKVLDIGCGDGRNIKTILNKTIQICGIDNDNIAINDAKQNFSANNNVKIIKAEANSLPFEDKTFDAIIFFDLLQNLDFQKQEVLTEAKRVMKDNGIIILCTYSENAFDERIKMYNLVNVPIEKIQGTKIFFEKSVGANISEQFSLSEIESFTNKAGFKISDLQKIGDLAYICTLSKIL